MYYDFLPSCALQKVLNGSSRRKSHLILFSFSVTTKFILLLGILLIAGSSQIHYNSGTGVQSGSSSFVVLAAAHSSDFSPSPPSSSSPLLTPLSSIAKHDDIAFPNTRLLVLSSSSSKGRRQLLAIPSTTSSIPQAKLCYIYFPSGRATTSTWHAHFALHEYHHRPHDTVNFTLSIIQKDRNENPTIAAKAVLEQGKDCDIFLGPRTSSYSSFVGPIAEVPMISESATSTALSDKSLFKYFSRTALADDSSAKAMTRLMHHMNITSLSIICIDDSFGKSLASQIRSNFKGTIEKDFCWGHTTSVEDMVQTLQLLKREATSSVLMLAMSPKQGFLVKLSQALLESGVGGEFTMFVSDSICTSDLSSGNDMFRGAFCTLQGLDETAATKYQTAWTNFDKRKLDYLTDPSGNLGLYNFSDPNLFNAYSALMADGVQLAMEVMRQAYQQYPNLQTMETKGDLLLDLVRQVQIDNATSGKVRLDTNTGDRTLGQMELFNIFPDDRIVSVGRYTSGLSDAENLKWAAKQDVFLVGHGLTSPQKIPSFERDLSEEDPEPETTTLIVLMGGIVGTVVIALFILSLVFISSWSFVAFTNLAFSSVWIVVGSIIGHIVDAGTDILGWYVVLSRGGSPVPFVVLYTILTVCGLAISTVESVRLIKFFRIYCQHADTPGGLPMHTELFWTNSVARISVLTMVIEDIPMVVMATAAVLQESSVVLLISLSVSAVACGSKLGKVTMVLKSLTLPEVVLDAEHRMEASSIAAGHHLSQAVHVKIKKQATIKSFFGFGSTSSKSKKQKNSAASIGTTMKTNAAVLLAAKKFKQKRDEGIAKRRASSLIITANSPPFMVRQFSDTLNPERKRALLHHAMTLNGVLTDHIDLDPLEFFAVTYHIMNSYEGYEKEEDSSSSGEEDEQHNRAHEPENANVGANDIVTDTSTLFIKTNFGSSNDEAPTVVVKHQNNIPEGTSGGSSQNQPTSALLSSGSMAFLHLVSGSQSGAFNGSNSQVVPPSTSDVIPPNMLSAVPADADNNSMVVVDVRTNENTTGRRPSDNHQTDGDDQLVVVDLSPSTTRSTGDTSSGDS